MRISGVAVCLSFFLVSLQSPGFLAAGETAAMKSDEQKRIVLLIEQLNQDQFVSRELAEKQLLLIGSQATDQIRAATEHRNPEIRYRAQRLLKILSQRSADAYAQALKERIVAFSDGKGGVTLPGWKQFKSEVGDNQDSRRLFANMHRAEHQLLLAYSKSPRDAATVWPVRAAQRGRDRRQQGLQQMPTGMVMALLWVASDESIDLPRRFDTVAGLLRNQSIKDVEQNTATRKLIANWIERLGDAEENVIRSLSRGIGLAERFELKEEAISLAIKLLQNANDAPPNETPIHICRALIVFPKIGDISNIGHVEPSLDDARPIFPGKDVKVQIRDIALMVLLYLSGQNFENYHLKNPFDEKGNLKLSKNTGFKNPKQRDEANERWRAWSKAIK